MSFASNLFAGELVHYQRLLPLLLLAMANSMPLLVISALSGYNVDFDSSELEILPMALIPYTAFIVGLAVMLAQGPISRLYLKPVSNRRIIDLFFVPGVILTGLGIVGSVTLWNLIFGMNWPAVRSALLGVIFWSALHPSLRVSMKSPGRVLEILGVVVLLWLWAFHFGFLGRGHQETSLWNLTTIGDIALLLVIVTGGYLLSLLRLADDRCGRSGSLVIDFFKRLQEKWDQRPIAAAFSWGPLQGYASYEWAVRGVPFLLTLTIVAAVGLCVALLSFARSTLPLSTILVDLGAGLPVLLYFHVIIAGLVGFLIPFFNDEGVPAHNPDELNESARRIGIGDYRATLPVTDKEIALAVFRSIAKCLTLSLGLLLLFSIAVVLLAGWTNVVDELRKTTKLSLPALAAIGALASWAAMANGTTLGYYSVMRKELPLVIASVAVLLFSTPLLHHGFTVAIFILAVGFAGYQFYRAQHAGLMTKQCLLLSLFCFFLVGFAGWFALPKPIPLALLLLCLLLPLAVVWPFANLPLAIRDCRRC